MELIVEQTDNLANFFLLPLIKRSTKDFHLGKFVNSYLDIEAFQIVVEIEEMKDFYKNYSGYDYAVTQDDRHFLFYDIPEIFHTDVARFVDGKYSEFSDAAKTFIRKYAKLPFKQFADGKVVRSVWLHVMDRSEELRNNLERELGVSIPEYLELASKPNNNNFFHNI